MDKKILLVDDDDIVNLVSEHLIKSWGLSNQIHAVSNGREALEIFNAYYSGKIAVPDVILLDLNMPVMDGFEFIQAFQKLTFPNKENVRIIILSSSGHSSDIDRAKKLGIHHYIVKPLTEEKLKATLSGL